MRTMNLQYLWQLEGPITVGAGELGTGDRIHDRYDTVCTRELTANQTQGIGTFGVVELDNCTAHGHCGNVV